MKKRGFGVGKWNGFGGKLNASETVIEAAHRELKEEAGISADMLEPIGVIDFSYHDSDTIHEVHIFRAEHFSGIPRETDEMRPAWFHIDKLPYADMWPDDEHWLPLLLEKKKFRGAFSFDAHGAISDMKLIELL